MNRAVAPQPPAAGTPTWEVHAIRYATLSARRSQVFLDGAPTDDGEQVIDYYVWVLVQGDRAILVDTGCRREIAERRGRTYLREPHEALKALGIAPEAIADVIISHLHYDHAGNLARYPAARLHLQEREMQFATGPMMCAGPLFTGAIEQEDILSMVRSIFAQRVIFVGDKAEISPGVHVHRIGGHTPGLQAVQVWTQRGWLVLASDGSHLYENMHAGRPFHIVADVKEMVDGWATLHELAASADHVIPGHDPLVLAQYPASRPDVPDVVSLHVAPRVSAPGPSH